MQNMFKFETFVDVHSNIFEEYLSSVIAKLPEGNEDYRALQKKIEDLYQKYPKVQNMLDMEMEAIYFRGCYDGVGYLKKAGIFV